jgi:hypothetical protein
MEKLEIEKSVNSFTKQTSYRIIVKELNLFEIIECFRSQYPKQRAVIISVSGEKIKGEYKIKMFLVGLNLGGKK